MYTIEVRNVNDAFYHGVKQLVGFGDLVACRGGKTTLELREPVATIYHSPAQRVLFCRERDANPFLHLFEALWMLAGRRDLKFMQELTKNFDQFADDGVHLQGSYGYKWREQFGYDQIRRLIDILRDEPDSRRAVLSMWSPEDLTKNYYSADIPCNTQVYFKVRDRELRMTVCNRSNDMLLGAYGANVVHMSMLQEYIAGHLGLRLGSYTQVSDSFHVYTDSPVWDRVRSLGIRELSRDLYNYSGADGSPQVRSYPMKANADWDVDLTRFFRTYDDDKILDINNFKHPWWVEVAIPMWIAYKRRDAAYLEFCKAEDWALVGREWLERRTK